MPFPTYVPFPPDVLAPAVYIRGPGVALGLVTPAARAARAARTVLRGTSRGFAAVLMRGFAAN